VREAILLTPSGDRDPMRPQTYIRCYAAAELRREHCPRTDDWANVSGATDVLHDVPTRCMICRQLIPITEVDPVLVVGESWQNSSRLWLYAAHNGCLSHVASHI
jgi:hypothetical protein